MFADEIRRAIEAASRITLPQVTALLWRAYGDGQVTEAEAEALSGLIEARTDAPALQRGLHAARAMVGGVGLASLDPASTTASENAKTLRKPVGSPRRPGTGSRPRTDASMERRRRWAASGRLPPGLASRFTLAEQAVLALVAAETAWRGDCRLAVGHVAAIAGVSETTVRNAIREAKRLDLVTVEERPVTGFRNLPNIVRIVGREWTAWLRLARKTNATNFVGLAGKGGPQSGHPSPAEGGGCKSPNRTHTQVLNLVDSRTTAPSQGLPETGCRPRPTGQPGIRASGRAGRAMR